MKTRAFVMLGLALLLAVASVYLARNWLQRQVQPTVAAAPGPQIAVTQIIVATAPVQFGNAIRREHLRLVDWPKDALPEGHFSSIDEVLGDRSEERVALKPISKNEPLLRDKVSGFGGRASLSAMISEGMRATTIRVNDVNGVAGFVLPGDRVDILLTRNPSGGRTGPNLITDVLLQNMRVLGIDQDANENREKPSVVKAVTLEVTMKQAQKLTLAQRIGQLSLALRNAANADALKPQTVSMRDLRVGEANDAANVLPQPADKTVAAAPVVTPKKTTVIPKSKKPVSSVRIVRGLESREYEVRPEKPTFSSPAFSKPLDILPSTLAPKTDPLPNLLPAVGDEQSAGSVSGSATSEPISLLRKERGTNNSQ